MKCPQQCAKQAWTRKPHYKTTTIRPWHQHMTWNSHGSALSNPWNAKPIKTSTPTSDRETFFITRGQFEHAPTMNSPARAQSLLFPPWRCNLCGKEQHVALSPNFHTKCCAGHEEWHSYTPTSPKTAPATKSNTPKFSCLSSLLFSSLLSPRCFLFAYVLFSSFLFSSFLFFSLLFFPILFYFIKLRNSKVSHKKYLIELSG